MSVPIRCLKKLASGVKKIFMLKGEPVMTRFVADELATAHWFDIGAAKEDLGYIPRVSIQEGLSRLEKWMKEEEGGANIAGK